MNERQLNIKKERIKKNTKELQKIKIKRKNLKLIRNSIAVAALVTTAIGSFIYRFSPADGAIFYVSGENDTKVEHTNFESDLELIETKNGRLITKEGAEKVYTTKVKTENGYKHIKISLPQIVSLTDGNSLKPETVTHNNEKMYVRTVPSSDSTFLADTITSLGIITLLGDLYISGNRIDEINDYETKLNIKTRKLKRDIRRNK